MAAILGLVGAAAAASVDCHLLERNCLVWVDETEARTTGDWAVAHRLRTRWQESDMTAVCEREGGGSTSSRRKVRLQYARLVTAFDLVLSKRSFLRFPTAAVRALDLRRRQEPPKLWFL